MDRPLGVAILAGLGIIGGIFALLGGIALLAAGALLGGLITAALLESSVGFFLPPAFLGFFFGVFGAIVLVLGLLVIVLGWGLWAGKDWARLITIVLTGIGALFALIALVSGGVPSIFALAIDALIIWYLTRPHVVAFFRQPSAYRTSIPGDTPRPP